MNRNIFITWDYELFMGPKTGSVNNCLIKPLNELLSALGNRKVTMTFFVDCAYLFRSNELRSAYPLLEEDYQLVLQNLHDILNKGHEIQMHVHPQWYFSTFDGEKWIMDFAHYKLSDIEDTKLISLFAKSKSLLDEICGYSTIAYRAGGFSIDDCRIFPKLFKDNGIMIDSSVVIGSHFDSSTLSYDYRNVHQKDCWRFSDSVSKEDINGPFIELPIGTHKSLGIMFYLNKIKTLQKPKGDYKRWGDGVSVVSIYSKWHFLNEKIRNAFSYMPQNASIDTIGSRDLEKSFHHQQGKYFVLISHPKNLSPQSICDFINFIDNHPDCHFVGVSSLLNK